MKQPHASLAILTLVAGIGGTRPGVTQTASAPNPDSAAIVRYLERTVSWYRQLDVLRQLATEPGETLQLSDNQRLANQVVQLAFEFARADADFIDKQAASSRAAGQGSVSSRYLALSRLSDRLDGQIREARAEIEALRQKLGAATGRQRQTLLTQLAANQSELSLAEARRGSLRIMQEFVEDSSANGLGATGLRAEIEGLARSVPGALAKPASGTEGAPPAGGSSYTPPPAGTLKGDAAGMWGLMTDLFALSGKNRALTNALRLTDDITELSQQLRSPLVGRLREMSRRSDDLARQADSTDTAELEREKKELDALTGEFKQTSSLALPLRKQTILVDLYRRNLTEWQQTVKSRFASELKSLLFRLAFLAVLLTAALGAAGLWRRTILRYVHDARRRHQYLLLRKIVLWCVIALILVFSFANELGSVATFAGLMTAGIAVAMQGVILSVVGYFFLIGKFGIRVGDLVQVAGVTGEVVDIGLVRFHLLELVGGGGKIPTGRVVAFANSIVFQSSSGLFKQVPGTSFGWHEVSVALSPECELKAAEDMLRQTVESVFAGYRDEMEQQHKQLERTMTVAPVGILHPTSRLRLTQTSPEVVIRYPVDLKHASAIDDRVTLELLKAVEREPKVKLAGSGTSGIKLTADLSGSGPKAGS